MQRVNAVESVSNVDVVCTDKTGTLTTGRLTVAEVLPVGAPDADGGRGGARLDGPQRRRAEPDQRRAGRRAARASRWRCATRCRSARRCGGARCAPTTGSGCSARPRRWPRAVAGLADRRRDRADRAGACGCSSFARAADPAASAARRRRPARCCPLSSRVAVVALADELRPDVPETLARLDRRGHRAQGPLRRRPRHGRRARRPAPGSGDGDARARGPTCDELSDAELDAVVAGGTVFGRIAPEQKERIVARPAPAGPLRGHGRRRRQRRARAEGAPRSGVAMRSGSAVTRDVADIVLIDDSMAALLPARRRAGGSSTASPPRRRCSWRGSPPRAWSSSR